MTNPPSGQGHWPQPPQQPQGPQQQPQQPAGGQNPSAGQYSPTPQNQGPWIVPQHPAPRKANGWSDQQPQVPPVAPPPQGAPRPGQPAPQQPQAQPRPTGWVTPPAATMPAAAVPAATAPTQTAQANYPAGSQPRSSKPKWPWALAAALVILALLSLGGYFLLRPNEPDNVTANPAPSQQAGTDSATAAPSGQTAASGEDSAGGDTSGQGASAAPAVESDPGKRLEQLKKEDNETAQADLKDRWVPQLSSKKVGLEAEGKKWTNEDILAEHERLRKEFPRVKLLWSGDWNSFQNGDFWVTVVGIGYTDKEDALRWCTSNGFDADHCYAKKLTTSGGTEGTTFRG